MHQQTDVGDYGKFKCNPVFVIGRYADQIEARLGVVTTAQSGGTSSDWRGVYESRVSSLVRGSQAHSVMVSELQKT